ncbi:hypothetical protein D3C73_1360080 [compost metagenome]
MIDASVQSQNVDHDARDCDPGQEMRQIDQRLNALLEAHVSNLAEQDCHEDRHDNTDNDFDNGNDERIRDGLCRFLVLKDSREIIETDPL